MNDGEDGVEGEGPVDFTPLLDNEPSLNTYIMSGRCMRAAYSSTAPMQRPARSSFVSPSARLPPW